MKVTVHIINAFVDNSDGGNPAGVVLDADGEDAPNLLKKIINFSKEFPNKIITVNRTKKQFN